MNEPEHGIENGVTIVLRPCDVELTGLPFGKRWRQQTVSLAPEHLRALHEGQYVAVDVQNEYVVFLRLELKEGAGDGE